MKSAAIEKAVSVPHLSFHWFADAECTPFSDSHFGVLSVVMAAHVIWISDPKYQEGEAVEKRDQTSTQDLQLCMISTLLSSDLL